MSANSQPTLTPLPNLLHRAGVAILSLLADDTHSGFHCLRAECGSARVMVSKPHNGAVHLTCKECGWTHWNVPITHELFVHEHTD